MPDFTDVRNNTVPLDFTDEKFDIGDRQKFVTKANQLMAELEAFSATMNESVSDISDLSDELSDPNVLLARMMGFLTFQTKAGLDAFGAPPTAAPSEELAYVWGGNEHRVFAWNGAKWVQAGSFDLIAGYRLQHNYPNIYDEPNFKNIGFWFDTQIANVSTYNDRPCLHIPLGEDGFMSKMPISRFEGSSSLSASFRVEYKGNSLSRIFIRQYDSSDTLLTQAQYNTDALEWTDPQTITFDNIAIDSGATYVRVFFQANSNNGQNESEMYISEIFIGPGPFSVYRHPLPRTKETVYVDPAGDDANEGTELSPVSSIARAVYLLDGIGTVILNGGQYDGLIDVRDFDDVDLEIRGANDQNAVVSVGEVIGSGVWVKPTIYPNIWRIGSQGVLPAFIFDIENPNETTLIDKPLPRHGGRQYRMEVTNFSEASSIEAMNNEGQFGTPSWYDDGSFLYIRGYDATTFDPNNLTLYKPTTLSFFSGTADAKIKNLKLKNLMFFGGRMLLDDVFYDLDNVRVYGSDTHGLQLGGCRGSMRDVEVAACVGRGAHIDNDSEHNYHDIQNLYTHDNQLSGLDVHGNAVVHEVGGLSEYNGREGMRAYAGGSLTCRGSIARHNGQMQSATFNSGYGFVALVAPSSKLLCIDCLSERNHNGFMGNNGSQVTLINCHDDESSQSSYQALLGSTIDAYNCTESSPTRTRVISSTLTAHNGSALVSA